MKAYLIMHKLCFSIACFVFVFFIMLTFVQRSATLYLLGNDIIFLQLNLNAFTAKILCRSVIVLKASVVPYG